MKNLSVFCKLIRCAVRHREAQQIQTLCNESTPKNHLREAIHAATVIRRDRGFLASGAELLTQDENNYTDVHA